MHLFATAELPRAGVGDANGALGMISEMLEALEERDVAGIRQPVIEEELRAGEDRRGSVHVVLLLHEGLVADTHGPHPAVAVERGLGALGQLRITRQAVERLHARAVAARDDVIDEVQKALHGLRRAEAVERLDDEIRIAQPAVAVVPVASAAGVLRDRRRERRDHGACVLVGTS